MRRAFLVELVHFALDHTRVNSVAARLKVTDDHLFIGNKLGDARIVSEGGDGHLEVTENRLPG